MVGVDAVTYVPAVKDNLVLIPAAPFVEVEPCSFFYCRRAHDPSVRFWNR